MAYEFKATRRVEFADTDMAGIVHFANFFKYMESAEHEFFRSVGLSIHAHIDGEVVTFPRVRVECEYEAPLRFDDWVEVHVLVREVRNKALVFDVIFRKTNDQPPSVVARGSMTTVCVRLDERTGTMRSIAIPAAIAEKFEVAPRELLEHDAT